MTWVRWRWLHPFPWDCPISRWFVCLFTWACHGTRL
jgi:hypothetical protein